MKYGEYYRKHKANYPQLVNPLFSKENWWRVILMTLGSVFIVTAMVYARQRPVPFSFSYYLRVFEYLSLIGFPFVAFLFWTNWRESIKLKRGYILMGKFEVVRKQASWLFYYLWLTPGQRHKVRVTRDIFEKTKIGDCVMIQKDALGKTEKVSALNKFSSRLARARTSRSLRGRPRDENSDSSRVMA